MMNCWEILGISETSDLAAVRKAYAAKAKEWHPEEHPEEFKRLQQAYRSAARAAKSPKGYTQHETLVHEQTADNEHIVTEIPAKTYPAAGEDDGETAQCYDYEEVADADLQDRFFTEFFCIAWNPYLMNSLACWEYVLKRSPYDRLLSDEAFRYNFVRTACTLSGWQGKTLLFFEKWLQSRTAGKETDLLCWKLRKHKLFEKRLSAQRCATNDQKKFHDIFLAQVARCGRDTRLTDEADMECYLSCYLPYAAANQSRVRELYHGNCQRRIIISTWLVMILVFIGMVIYVNVCVIPQMDAQQQIQKRADEIRKYNETLWENDGAGAE